MKTIYSLLIAIFTLFGCTDDPVEKCVQTQITAAMQAEKEAEERQKHNGGGVDWGKYARETPAQVEARARLQCLKAASGKS